jgi:hypothetical protein
MSAESKSNGPVVVAIVGANGQLGKLICEALLTRGTASRPVTVRAVCRRSDEMLEKLTEGVSEHSKLEIIQLDYKDTKAVDKSFDKAFTVVSTLQGMAPIIVDLQLQLLLSAMRGGANRFIPSDFSINYNLLPRGQNRNLDIRRTFHDRVAEISRTKELSTEVVSIFQGGFMELLQDFQIVNFDKRQVTYLGSADTLQDLTTWKNTAEFTAEVCLDQSPRIGRHLNIAGDRINAKGIQRASSAAFGAPFSISLGLSLWFLAILIWILKTFFPGDPNNILPLYQKLQYGQGMALGIATSALDNSRYSGIKWTKVEDYFKQQELKMK